VKNKIQIIIIASIFFGLLFIACGTKSQKNENSPSMILAENFENGSIVKSSEIRTFVGESLYEYINGGAEFYHLYKFTDVTTADYKAGAFELIADLYRFENSDYAFGLYSSLRPIGSDYIQLGAEGFATGNSLDFVKGEYLVRIIGYEDSDECITAIKQLAGNIDAVLNGSTVLPKAFSVFPEENLLSQSEVVFAESYLGRIYLTDAYTRKYQIDEETITLFVTEDKSGDKFLRWSEDEGDREIINILENNSQGSELLSFTYNDKYYDKVAVALYHGKLIGVINYNDNLSTFFESWLMSVE